MSSTYDIINTTQKTPCSKSSTRPQRARSSGPSSGADPPSGDTGNRGAEAYLDLFSPPALASTADTYFQSFAALRAILEGAPKAHAHAVLDAAEDVAESHVERRLAGGGQDHE
jgi:hypothetical protein